MVKAKEICNATALLMSIMDFSEDICQVRFTGSTSHRADQIRPIVQAVEVTEYT